MKTNLFIAGLFFLFMIASRSYSQESINMQGTWKYLLDPEDKGISDKWFEQEFDSQLELPGSLDEYRIGNPVEKIYMGKLTPETRYIGVAWYQKEVEVPESWKGRRIVMFLERACWETMVYVDDIAVPGTQNSLSTPHIHDLTNFLSPGKHRITLRVDNTVKINLGHTFGNMLWCHALTEETQTNWNGVIGKMELQSTPKVWVRSLIVHPDHHKRIANIKMLLGSLNTSYESVIFSITDEDDNILLESSSVLIPPGDTTLTLKVPYSKDLKLWDEYDPELIKWKVSLESLSGQYVNELSFGLKDFTIEAHHFLLNGRRIFLRGKVHSCIFPLTGYPPMDVESWKHDFEIYREYGLNHVRFHSWCPPRAAFVAADQLGMILQIEPPLWDGYGLVGSLRNRAAYLIEEVDRIVETYGSHPSFCLMSLGNELGDGSDPFLAYLLDYLQKKDTGRYYTSTTHPVGTERKDDFFNAAATPEGTNRGIKPFSDYRDVISGLDRPLITHELGQPAMYPDFDQISKYTGHLKPKNLEVFKASLRENGMLHQSDEFEKASGALLLEIYKENIEAQLRTPNVAGFQLLDIQDYPGQGNAVVGILDPFLDSKGLITPEEYRNFCSETVPLIRMPGFVYTNNQIFRAKAEVSHFGPIMLSDVAFRYRIINGKGKILGEGQFDSLTIPTGGITELGEIEYDLSNLKNAEKLRIEVYLPYSKVKNSWEIWCFPENVCIDEPADLIISRTWDDETRERVLKGAKALIIPEPQELENSVNARWEPVFWSYQLFKQPQEMGIICDPSHPSLKNFPTSSYSDWQWKEILGSSEALIINDAPHDFYPIIQFVPDFNVNHKFSALLEAKVGKGYVMISNIDLLDIKDKSVPGRQLYHSILSYLSGNKFTKANTLDIELVDNLLKVTPELENQSGTPDTTNAVLDVYPAEYAKTGEGDLWTADGNKDRIGTQKKGFDYSVEGSYYKDYFQSVWMAKNLKIAVSCPQDFKGSFYVYLLDQNDEDRSAAMFFGGRDRGPVSRYDRKGVWLKFEISPQMLDSGEVVFDARATSGPNVTVHRLVVIPDK